MLTKDETTTLYNNFYSLNKAPRGRKKKRNHTILRCVLNNVPAGSSVLDVGCGPGHLLAALETTGYGVQGTEVSEWAMKNMLTGLKVHKAYIDDMSVFPDNAFDCVVCSDVLEHLQTENEAIAGIKEMVRITKKHLVLTANQHSSRSKNLGEVKISGNNTHTLARKHEWWLRLFTQYFVVVEQGKAGTSLFVYGVKNEVNKN